MSRSAPDGLSADVVRAAKVSDRIVAFHQSSLTLDASPTDSLHVRLHVLCRFAEMVSQILLAGPVTVGWKDDAGASWARCSDLAETAEQLPEPLRTFGVQEATQYPPIALAWERLEGGLRARRVSWCSGQRRPDDVLWIAAGGPGVPPAEWLELERDIAALKQLFLALALPLSLHRENLLKSRAKDEVEVRERGRSLTLARFHGVEERIEPTKAWLAEVSGLWPNLDPTARALMTSDVTEVCVSILQELLRTGWTDRYPEPKGAAGAAATGKGLQDLIETARQALTKPGGETTAGDPARGMLELELVLGGLTSVLTRRPPVLHGRWSDHPKHDLLRSLSFWTGLQEVLRDRSADMRVRPAAPALARLREATDLGLLLQAAGSTGPVSGEQVRSQAVRDSMMALATILEGGWSEPASEKGRGGVTAESPAAGERPVVSFRSWLNLWFALEVLQRLLCPASMSALLAGERALLAADLAYVVRETVRRILYGLRQDYSREPATFAAALRTLVDYHSRVLCQTPHEYDVPRLLAEIGRYSGPDRGISPTEHLRHVLDVYVTGQFLLSLELRPERRDVPGEPSQGGQPPRAETLVEDRLASPFAGKASADRVLRLRRSFGLAALLHDYGYLIFPSQPAHRPLGSDALPGRTMPMAEVTAATLETGRKLGRACTSELVAGGVLDPSSDRRLLAWLEGRTEGGEPDHGLLAAHHLFRISPAAAGEERDVVRGAVRAVLLHNAVGVPLHADTDPAASLLVVCNELCEWDPSRGAAGSTNTRRSLRAVALGLRSGESRYRAVGLLGLEHHVREGRLVSSLPEVAWPRIEIILQPPRRLDRPSFLIWLQKAQTAGRLHAVGRIGWKPVLEISSEPDPDLQARGFTGQAVLEWLAQHSRLAVRPWLVQWLTHARPFKERAAALPAGWEHVTLEELETPLCPDDVVRHLADLEAEAEVSLLGLSSPP